MLTNAFVILLKKAIELYGPEIAVSNIHSCCHLGDDYIESGPLDEECSGYPFESFDGKKKNYVHSFKGSGETGCEGLFQSFRAW